VVGLTIRLAFSHDGIKVLDVVGLFRDVVKLVLGVEGYLLSCELQLKDREDAKWEEIEQLMDDSVASEFEKLESYPVGGVPLLEACQARRGDLIALKNQTAQEECMNLLKSQLCEKNSCPNPGPSYLGLVWELLRVCLNCCNWSKTSIDNSRACRGHADPPVATRHTCMLHFHGFFFLTCHFLTNCVEFCSSGSTVLQMMKGGSWKK